MIMYPMAVGRVLTRVLEAGDEAGKPVVLLHGLTSRADRWRGTIDVLADAGYHVFAPDLPGHGFAAKQPGDHSIPGYRDFLLDFLDIAGIAQARLIGTSLGGHVAAAAACHRPERVAALAMIGSLGLQPITSERVGKIQQGLADMSMAAMRRRLLTVFTDPRFVTDELVAEDVRINTSPGAVESLLEFTDYMAARFNDDLVLEHLVGLGDRLPMLLLWGEEDQSVPVEIGRAARAALPLARLVTFARAGHTPYIEQAGLFNDAVCAFLAGELAGLARPGMTCI